MQKFFSDLSQNWQQYLWMAFSILLIWVIAHISVRVVGKIIQKLYMQRAQKLTEEAQRRLNTTSTVLQSIAKYLIWFIAAAGMVGQLGLTSTMGSMLTAAGIGGIALGIGAQSFIKDVVTGIFFVFEDQIAVGDYVTIAGITGTVQEITLRITSVKSFRGEINVIPNGSIGIITNYSREDYFTMIDVDIAYETDIMRAMDCIREEAEAYASGQEHVTGLPQMLGVTALSGNGVTLRMIMRVRPMTQFETERALNLRIKQRFDREGIQIPYKKLILAGAQQT